MKLPSIIPLLCLTLLVSFPGMAQTKELQDLPGYVDFSALQGVYGTPKVEVNLGPSMLAFVVSLAGQEEPELAELLKKIKGVNLRVYPASAMAGGTGEADAKVTQIVKHLQQGAWEQIVSVNESGNNAQIFARFIDGNIEGITVLANSADSDAVFINIIGQISPDELSKVTGKFGVQMP